MAWGTDKAFGLLKASLTELIRLQMQQNVGFDIICENLFKKRVSKPSIFIILLSLNEPKAVMVCIDSFKLQTMTAFNQKFLQGGPGGAVFSKSAPPGRRRLK